MHTAAFPARALPAPRSSCLPCPGPYLVVVGLTVGQALLLIVPVPQERLLTLGADKVLGWGVGVQGGQRQAWSDLPAHSQEAEAAGWGSRWADTSTDCSWSADPTPSLMPGGAASSPGPRGTLGPRVGAGEVPGPWRVAPPASGAHLYRPRVTGHTFRPWRPWRVRIHPPPGGRGPCQDPRQEAAQGRDCGTQSWPGHRLARLPARWCP